MSKHALITLVETSADPIPELGFEGVTVRIETEDITTPSAAFVVATFGSAPDAPVRMKLNDYRALAQAESVLLEGVIQAIGGIRRGQGSDQLEASDGAQSDASPQKTGE